MNSLNVATLKAQFGKYRDDTLLTKLETYALWTIPSVFPRENTASQFNNTEVEYDSQSKGALVVNRLATKLARTLFPANTSFFRMELSDEVKALFESQEVDNITSYENRACARIFLNASYAQLVQLMRLLIITGEGLMYRVDESIRVFSLRDYTVKRNNVGKVLDIITRESKFYSELSDKTKGIIGGQKHADDRVELYTRCQFIPKNNTWKVTQEINGKDIGTDVVYRDKLCPYIPVTWNFVNGDNYGRGYVEDYAADLYKYSNLSQSLAEYELEALKLIHLVNPAGLFDVPSAEEAESGAYIQGQPESVQPYEAGDYRKILEIRNDLQAIEQRLDVAFMYTGNTREGERITAYEIRQNAEEAENVLGGVYSQLSQNMHLPLAYLLLNEEDAAIIYEIDAKNLTLNILTGLQALSRSSENQSLVIAASEINAVLPAFTGLGLSEKWNIDAIAESIMTANGVNLKLLQYTEEELEARQQAAQQAAAQQEAQAAQTAMQGASPMGGQLSGQESAVAALGDARMM